MRQEPPLDDRSSPAVGWGSALTREPTSQLGLGAEAFGTGLISEESPGRAARGSSRASDGSCGLYPWLDRTAPGMAPAERPPSDQDDRLWRSSAIEKNGCDPDSRAQPGAPLRFHHAFPSLTGIRGGAGICKGGRASRRVQASDETDPPPNCAPGCPSASLKGSDSGQNRSKPPVLNTISAPRVSSIPFLGTLFPLTGSEVSVQYPHSYPHHVALFRR